MSEGPFWLRRGKSCHTCHACSCHRGALASGGVSPVFEPLEPRLLLSTLYWDPDGNWANNNACTGAGLGGTGNWNLTSPYWWADGTCSNVPWNNSGGDQAVFFGCGTPGPVTLTTGITVGGIEFLTDGYTLRDCSLSSFAGCGCGCGCSCDLGVSLAAGVSATIESEITPAGDGGLSVSGDGTSTLTVSGTNSYSGSTTISGATLRVTTASLPGDVANEGTLVFDQEENDTYDSSIWGSGSVVVTGGCELGFSGQYTYSGGTTVDGGTTLRVGVCTLPGDVISDGTLLFQDTFGEFGGAITGGGSVSVTGCGTQVTLSGTITGVSVDVDSENSVTLSCGSNELGGASVNSCATLRVVAAGALTSGAGVDGTLIFDLGEDFVYGGQIGGSGTVTVAVGSHKLTFTGENTYTGGTTIEEGTLQVNTGSLPGHGEGGQFFASGEVTLNIAAEAADVADMLKAAGIKEVESALAADGVETVSEDEALASSAGSPADGEALTGGDPKARQFALDITVDQATLTGLLDRPSTDKGYLSLTMDASGALVLARPGGGKGESASVGALDAAAEAPPDEGEKTAETTPALDIAVDPAIFAHMKASLRLRECNVRLVVDDSGALVLTSVDSGVGGKEVGFGLLSLTTGEDVFINSGASLIFEQEGEGEYNGWIGGYGSVTVTGCGAVVTLSGENGYSGGTTVDEDATLRVTTCSLPTGAVVDGTLELSFVGSCWEEFGHGFSGSGEVRVYGCGGGSLTGTVEGALALVASDVTLSGAITDDVSLTAAEGGDVLLTCASNSYGGGTMVESGATLRVTQTCALPGNATVCEGGTLVFDGVSGGDYGGGISGGGTVQAAGSSVTLSGTITGVSLEVNCESNVSLSGGSNSLGANVESCSTLTVAAAGALTDGASVDGTLVFDFTTPWTYAGDISGTGSVVVTGGADLTLSGQNSMCDGSVTVCSGSMLTVGTGSLPEGVTVDGTLVFHETGGEYGGGISGGGAVIISDSDVAFTGQSSFGGTTTVNEGATLRVTTCSLSGDVTADGTLVFQGDCGGEYGGAISGGGVVQVTCSCGITMSGAITGGVSLVVTDGGVLTLTGDLSYSGDTLVSNGTLILDGGDDTLPTGTTVTLGDGQNAGTLNLNGHNQTLAGLQTPENDVGSRVVGGSCTPVTLTLDLTEDFTFGGILGGDSDEDKNLRLVKDGPATLTLSGGNNYTGGTCVLAGTLQVAPGSLPGDVILYDGNLTFDVATSGQYDGVISGYGSVTLVGGGALTLTNCSGYAGATLIKNGTVVLGINNALPTCTCATLGDDQVYPNTSGVLKLDGHSQELAGVETQGEGTGNQVVNGSETPVTLYLFVPDRKSFTFGGVVGGDGDDGYLALTKSGPGTQALTGYNDYAGDTCIAQGALRAVDGVGLPSDSHLIFNGGVLEGDGTATFTRDLGPGTCGGEVEWLGSGGFSAYGGKLTVDIGGQTCELTTGGYFVSSYYGMLLFGSQAADDEVEFKNPIEFDSALVVNVEDNPGSFATLSGTLSGLGSLVLYGSGGTLRLAAETNTYTGDTAICHGTLVLAGGVNTLPETAVVILRGHFGSSACLDLNGNNQQLAGLGVGVGGNSSANRVRSDTAAELALSLGDDYDFEGVLEGALSLTLSGGHSLTLSGVSTYTGETTIEDGTLILNGGDNTLAATAAVVLGDGSNNAWLDLNGCDQELASLTVAPGSPPDGAGVYSADAATLTINVSSGVVILAGILTDNLSLVKKGSGRLELSGESCYFGDTAIQDGTLRLVGDDGTLPEGTKVTLGDSSNHSGTLELYGHDQVLGGLTTAGGASNHVVNGNEIECTLFLCIAPGEEITFGGVVGGTGDHENNFGVTKEGYGTQVFSCTNTYTGDTTILSGALRANDGVGLPSDSHLVFGEVVSCVVRGGVLEGNGTATFTRDLGPGTCGGEVEWMGSGGFAAHGGKLTVNLGNGSPPSVLAWASGNFVPAGAELWLNSLTANDEVEFRNRIDLDGGTRTIRVFDNETCSADLAEISGEILNTCETEAGLTKSGIGLLYLTAENTYDGATTILAGAVRAAQGTGLPDDSNLTFDGGVWESDGDADFVRNLGTGAGEVQWLGDGGFSAHGGKLTINIGDEEVPDTLTWGSDGLVPSGSRLLFASLWADDEVDFTNPIALGEGSREVYVEENADSCGDLATISGELSGDGDLVKIGPGTLKLTATNTYEGATTIEDGVLRVDGAILSEQPVTAVRSGNGQGGTLAGSGYVRKSGSQDTLHYRVIGLDAIGQTSSCMHHAHEEGCPLGHEGAMEITLGDCQTVGRWQDAVRQGVDGTVFSCYEAELWNFADGVGFLVAEGKWLREQLPGSGAENWGTAGGSKFIVFAHGGVCLYLEVFVDKHLVHRTSTGTRASVGHTGVTVDLATGALSYNGTDLGNRGARRWTTQAPFTPYNRAGNGWSISQWPQVINGGDGRVIVDGAGPRQIWFDYDSDTETYVPGPGNLNTLTHFDEDDEFVLVDTTGNVIGFHDWTVALKKRGQFKSFTDPGGNVTSVLSSTQDGNIQEVRRYVGSCTEDVLESYYYTYFESGASAGLLSSVELRRPDGGNWTVIRHMDYTYYETLEVGEGNIGDLMKAVLMEGEDVLETNYYRYYTAGDEGGYPSALKYVFNGPAYARLCEALHEIDPDLDPEEATDEQIAPYADSYMEYDIQHRVTKVVTAGAGNEGQEGGQGTYTYSYEDSQNPDGPNSWARETIETLPGYDADQHLGARRITYSNYFGGSMLDVVEDAAETPTQWCTFHQYNADGQEILTAMPSAFEMHNGKFYDPCSADLLCAESANYEYLKDGDGLVTVTEYYSDTWATEECPGGVKGYVAWTGARHGEWGSSFTLTCADYTRRSCGEVTIYPLNSVTLYNESGTRTTSYAYDEWFEGTVQAKSVTTTLPVVPTAQHGSCTADETVVVYDFFGRPVWTKDADGYIDYAAYDQVTGAVVKTITDVEYCSLTCEEQDSFPTGWAEPEEGLHLVTLYTVDELGRTTKAHDPNGIDTYTVYLDAAHETRVYPGWNSSTHQTTGPTVVTRQDWARGYTETLTMSAAPAYDEETGEPTGTEEISDIQTLSRVYINPGKQVVRSDQYFDFDGVEYSQDPDIGEEGTNFLRTEYAYNARGLPARTEDPAGVIRRTIHDALGRTESEWIGTDDTPTCGEWPTCTEGTDMVKTALYVYDDGGVGDGNLTQSLVFVADGVSYATDYNYDWRDRRTDTRGPDKVATHVIYNNLGEVTDTCTYADADVDFVIDSCELRGWTETRFDDRGRVYQTQVHEVSSTGVIGGHLTSDVWYNKRGLVMKTRDPTGLFGKTQYDGAGRLAASYVSFDPCEGDDWEAAGTITDDTLVKATFTEYSGDRISQVKTGTSAENAVVVEKYWYDTCGDGSGNPTIRLTGMSTLKPLAELTGTDGDYVITNYEYDDAGRRSTTILPDPDGGGDLLPAKIETTFDMLGRGILTETSAVDGESETLLAKTENLYNSAGQLSASRVYEVSAGAAGDYLETAYSYDGLGLLCKVAQPGGAFTKTLHNAWGRVLGTYTGTDEGASTEPTDLTDDTIVTQTVPFYDGVGRVWLTQSYQRHDGASCTGALTADNARVTYAVTWFDDLGRTKWVADYGTNGGTAITCQAYDFDGDGAGSNYADAQMPTRTEGNSDDYILTQYYFDGYGRQDLVVDNSDKKTKTFFDDAGRKTHVVENYDNFTPTNETTAGDAYDHAKDRVTKFVYNDAGLLTQQIALDANGDGSLDDNQVTSYVYAIDLDPNEEGWPGSPVPDNSLLRAVVYPDSTDDLEDVIAALNACEGGDFVETAYNAAGLVHTSTDQRGVEHTYGYDDTGRRTSDAVTALPEGVDDSVLRIKWAYDDLGRIILVTSYDAAEEGDVVNQVAFAYDGWGNVATSWQSHDGAAVTAGENQSPHVIYSYDDTDPNPHGAVPYVRLESVTYPGGRVITYHYDGADGIDDALSRLSRIADETDSATYAAYTYLGAGTIVAVSHPAVDGGLVLDYDFDPQNPHTYPGWDRFGRVVQQTWTVDGTAVDSYGYTYDMNSNRTGRENVLNEDLSETYTYDGLDRLLTMDRGDGFDQDWTLDALGNWSSFNDDGQSQDRTHDEANQITAISGSGGANWVDPAYDAAGNMTLAPRPGQESDADEALLLVYDAWNRLVKAYKDDGTNARQIDAGDTLLAAYQYDGRGRRIVKTAGETTTHYFFNENWQVVETRIGADPDPLDQYVWDIRYVDAPVVRFHDGNTDEDYDDPEDNILYYTQDANWNVTALLSEGGHVVERYMYAAYGKVTVLDGESGYDADGQVTEWSPDAQGASDWANDRAFQGQERDQQTGLHASRVRPVYHPTLGVFASRDNSYVDGMNLYQFCRSNPVALTDPMGLCAETGQAPTPDLYLSYPDAGGESGINIFDPNNFNFEKSLFINDGRPSQVPAILRPDPTLDDMLAIAAQTAVDVLNEKLRAGRSGLLDDYRANRLSVRRSMGGPNDFGAQVGDLLFGDAIARIKTVYGRAQRFGMSDEAALLAACVGLADATGVTALARWAGQPDPITLHMNTPEEKARDYCFGLLQLGGTALTLDALAAGAAGAWNALGQRAGGALGPSGAAAKQASDLAQVAIRQRIVGNVAESQAARAASNFTQHAATERLLGFTQGANERLAASPALAQTVLTKAEYAAAQNSPAVGRLFYGHAVERLVAQDIGASTELSGLFKYVGGPGKPDFVGIGRYAGLNLDITTNTARQIGLHQVRPYAPSIVTYTRPTGFAVFP
ncbi:MAG: hypothetical protein FJ288_02640 [Planctomycetes bacterium]|nr:hypothetical protein [Planctomycetota bacterium]